jgi:hypothetical protein
MYTIVKEPKGSNLQIINDTYNPSKLPENSQNMHKKPLLR